MFLDFGKFGYDAHIRSYDDGDSPSGAGSGSATPRSSTSNEKGGTSSIVSGDSGFGKPLKLFQVPVVRQYWHKGIIWRASSAEEVQSFELFVDLLYVGILAIIGDATSEDPTGEALVKFIVAFALSWKIWNDMTLWISFDTEAFL